MATGSDRADTGRSHRAAPQPLQQGCILLDGSLLRISILELSLNLTLTVIFVPLHLDVESLQFGAFEALVPYRNTEILAIHARIVVC